VDTVYAGTYLLLDYQKKGGHGVRGDLLIVGVPRERDEREEDADAELRAAEPIVDAHQGPDY